MHIQIFDTRITPVRGSRNQKNFFNINQLPPFPHIFFLMHDISEMAPTIGIMCGHSLSRNAFNHHNSPSIVHLNLTRGGKTTFKCLFMARKSDKTNTNILCFSHISRENTLVHVLKKLIFPRQKQKEYFLL